MFYKVYKVKLIYLLLPFNIFSSLFTTYIVMMLTVKYHFSCWCSYIIINLSLRIV